jgi:hypothetical protein
MANSRFAFSMKWPDMPNHSGTRSGRSSRASAGGWAATGRWGGTPVAAPKYHSAGKFWGYRNPIPLGPEDFLASATAGDPLKTYEFTHSWLYLMDIHGNRELIHYNGRQNILHPAPIRPRAVPPAIPDRVAWPKAGEEPQKAGVVPAETDALVAFCRDVCRLPVVGLMCIPPADEEPALHFALLREIARRNGLAGLSMGMSGDFAAAIRFGATHVRFGTAIFGTRQSDPLP